jgi:hypothetical protein
MGRQGIEVEVEPITGEKRKTAWGQHLSQGVNHRMGHVLGAGAYLEDGQNLGAGINRQPEPEHVLRAAQPGSQFIQLEVWELQMAEGPLVQRLSMLPSASQPRRDGGLTGAEDPLGS